jgi:cytochrome P450
MRKVKAPMQVPDSNIVIPSSHFLLASPGASSIDSTYFPNPMEFDPHRWDNRASEEEGEKFDFGYGMVSKGTASPYLPFGAGRHRCIGEQFANVQLCTIVSIFVREFTMSLPGGKMPPIDYTVSPFPPT